MQISLTAWGVILAYALPKGDALAILVYPLLAHFIAYGWAFNNTRIFQIARYLRCREKDATEVWGLIFWENHIVKNEVSSTQFTLTGCATIKPGLAIFPGTQVTSLVIVGIIALTQRPLTFAVHTIRADILILVLFALALLVTWFTYRNIWASEEEALAPDKCSIEEEVGSRYR